MNLKILQSNILVKFYKFLITLISFVPHIFSNVTSKSYPTQSLKASSQLWSNNYMFHLSRSGGTRGPGGLRPLPFLHSGRIRIKKVPSNDLVSITACPNPNRFSDFPLSFSCITLSESIMGTIISKRIAYI